MSDVRVAHAQFPATLAALTIPLRFASLCFQQDILNLQSQRYPAGRDAKRRFRWLRQGVKAAAVQLTKYVYHLIEAPNWPSIQKSGLLPAAQLIRKAFAASASGRGLCNSQRATHTVLPTGVHIRDQKPMPATALSACLVGMTPPEWYAVINAHVFFWLDSKRLDRQRAACGTRKQYIAVVRTASLVEAFSDSIYLTPFNVGYALRKPAKRGRFTFVPYKAWLSSGWQSETRCTGSAPRSPRHQPAELLVRGAIPQFSRFVHAVVPLKAGEPFEPMDD